MPLHHILVGLLEWAARRHHRSARGGTARVGAGPWGRWPIAVYPVPTPSPLVVVACPQCGSDLGLSRWDRWNGFFVTCPQCGRTLGQPWDLSSIVLASMILNAFSFFFTLRPRDATCAVLAHAVFTFGGGWVVTRLDDLGAVFLAYMLILLLLPLVLNLFLFMNHEAVLQQADGRSTGPS